jgi:hypothetical protein
VAPVSVNISNCGTLIVKKVTDPSPDPTSTSFGFTVDGPNPPNTNLPKSFNLTDGQSNSTEVFAGTTFSAAETVPTNWTLVSATCDNGSGSLVGSTISNISVAADETVTCTFTDKLQLGAILVTKTAKNHNLGSGQHPLAGAKFTVNGVQKTTDADGHACFDGLTIGTTYTVTEDSAPTGYSIDTVSKDVMVSAAATCTSGTPDPVSFTDSPLTDVVVTATSEVPGVTNSTIDCGSAGNSGPLSDPANVTANGLTPGVYTCTITIDP